jgi:hypothetical protein
VAVTARALEDGGEVPLDQVWPKSIAALADGIRDGAFEQIAHGYLHLAPGSTEGAVESREFGGLDRAEADRRIRAALDWAEGALGARPRSFVAPNWVYGPGALEALDALDLPAFLPCEPAPLLDGRNVRESLVSTLDGLHGLDYGPLASLAAAGIPPYVVVHGGLIDSRFNGLDLPGDAAALARLAVRRDIVRLPSVPGVRWVGASEFIGALADHERAGNAG